MAGFLVQILPLDNHRRFSVLRLLLKKIIADHPAVCGVLRLVRSVKSKIWDIQHVWLGPIWQRMWSPLTVNGNVSCLMC